MAHATNIRLILDEILDVLPDLSIKELDSLTHHWKELNAYMQQPEIQAANFYTKLIDIVSHSPTLVSHRFPVVLAGYISRFPDEPGPNHNQPVAFQGVPPVHNEVIRIADKLHEMSTQLKRPTT